MNIYIKLVLYKCCNTYSRFEMLCVCDHFRVICHVLTDFK